uniref:Protein kinase domain-containing protein n=1 Tax=Meloidogyne javanica TaxID=6303 RepID=A0A915N7J2_MELJA
MGKRKHVQIEIEDNPFDQEEDELEISNEIKVLEEFNKLPLYEREGIIELYLHGQTINPEEDQKIISENIQKKENKDRILYKKVLILEYGGVDLRRKIDQIRENFYEEEIWFLIQKTLLAVKDTHRLIMHLDLKPDNMVYTSNDLIKIIDFGSGQFIQNEGEENENNKLANYCKLLRKQYTTQVYRGPENNIVCDDEESGEARDKTGENKLSPKADIWSMGIIILEYILNSPSMKRPLEIFRFLRGNITTNHRIEDNETKIDLRRLKWDNTNIKHKPPLVECDTENTAKATFNSTKKEIGKKKGKNKNEKHSEMSGYEGDAGGRSSFSLPSTPIREQFSSPILTDYETNQLISPQRSWSATPKREEYSSYTLNETD